MKSSVFMLTLLLLNSNIICGNKNTSKKIPSLNCKLNRKCDSKRLRIGADTLIKNFFTTKKIDVKNISCKMQGEFEFKKNILIKRIEALSSNTNEDIANSTKYKQLVDEIFSQFADRIKHIRVSEWNNKLIKAVRENSAQANAPMNKSYPNIDASKKYLLAGTSEY